uniref:Mediator complex subunit 19 n=1 Tax=Ascaris lumbricoides TaxID=6252 RepID=A0A0M3IJZ1_ASCLU
MLDYFTLPSTVDHLKSNSGRPSQVDHYFTISSHGPRLQSMLDYFTLPSMVDHLKSTTISQSQVMVQGRPSQIMVDVRPSHIALECRRPSEKTDNEK